ncbi:MAG: 16S rRNA (cytosine(1402)-N(4))-methyltransferase RsmH [Rhizomicrobium sp.]
MSGHVPVMLAEVLEALAPHDGGLYVDGTFGGGGYTKAILESCNCTVLGIDRDPAAIARGAALVEQYQGRLILVHGTFSNLDVHVLEAGFDKAAGVVLDLGVSSFQFDEPERGFSFRADGPLDMRMSAAGDSAADVVNTLDEKMLATIIARYGEEHRARAIARAIVNARPITRTLELAELVANVLGPKAKAQAIHPATRTFQALRIYVNGELDELSGALKAAETILGPGGRLSVVSFHSLEDRIVKQFLRGQSDTAPRSSRHVPEQHAVPARFTLLHRNAVLPGAVETAANPRARSAKMRAAEKLVA